MKFRVGGCLVLISLVSCTVGPDYQKTEPVVPKQWQALSAENFQISKTIDLKTYWQSFGDANLNTLINKALRSNLDIKIALARVDQARSERRGVRAELFPTVNATGGVQRQNNPFPGLAQGIKYNMFEMGFDALWEVDLYGRQQRRLESAVAEQEATNEDYREALVTLTSELARAYINYRSLQNQLRITHSNLSSQQHILKLTEQLFSEGVNARHDVVRAKAQVETTSAQIPVLEANLIATLHQLEVLVGQQPGSLATELNATDQMPVIPSQVFLTTPIEVIRHRPDIQAVERQLAAATAMKGAAIAEQYPKISISAFFGLRNTDIESLFKSAAFSYGTAANFVQPLLDFGRIQAGIDLAEAKQKEAYLGYEKTILEALQETETTLTQYLKEEVRRQTLARSITELQESVRLSELRYQEGVSTFLEVLDSQRTLYAAQIELSRSEALTATYLIACYKSLGGGVS